MQNAFVFQKQLSRCFLPYQKAAEQTGIFFLVIRFFHKEKNLFAEDNANNTETVNNSRIYQQSFAPFINTVFI